MISSSTAVAQILGFLFSTITSRLYDPSEFGILSLFGSITALTVVASTLSYENAIPLSENDEESVTIFYLSLAILFAYSITIMLISIFFGRTILSLVKADVLVKYIYLIPISIFLTGLYNILLQWNLRVKDFSSISRTKLSQTIFGNFVKIIFGVLKLGPIGLLVGQITSQAAGTRTLSKSFVRSQKNVNVRIEKSKIFDCAKLYKNFPLFYVPDQLVNAAGLQLPNFFLAALYGNEVLGMYTMASSVVNLPIMLIGDSISNVFFSEVASIGKSDPQSVRRLSLNLFKKLFLLSLIPLAIFSLFGPPLFSIIFGEKWYEAGKYAVILSFLSFSRLVFVPISGVYTVYDKQKDQLFLDLFRLISLCIIYAVAPKLQMGSYVYVTLSSLIMIIQYLIGFLLAQKIIKNQIELKSHE